MAKVKAKVDVLDELVQTISVPTDNGGLPNPIAYQYWKQRQDRILVLYDQVDDDCHEIITDILMFNREDAKNNIPVDQRKPIKLYINTPGGDLDMCLALIDIMEASQTPIYTYNIGMCASAGLFIFLAGSKRFTLKNGQFLYHSGSGGASGTYEQAQAQAAHYKACIERLRAHFLAKSGVTEKVFNKKKNTEWWIFGDEAIHDYTIATDLITSLDEIV